VKRARLTRVHALLIGHLKGEMPAVFGKVRMCNGVVLLHVCAVCLWLRAWWYMSRRTRTQESKQKELCKNLAAEYQKVCCCCCCCAVGVAVHWLGLSVSTCVDAISLVAGAAEVSDTGRRLSRDQQVSRAPQVCLRCACACCEREHLAVTCGDGTETPTSPNLTNSTRTSSGRWVRARESCGTCHHDDVLSHTHTHARAHARTHTDDVLATDIPKLLKMFPEVRDV
jgi:hypothetical protein